MDKMRSGFPIEVNFYDGEMPTGAKMRGLARQAKNGISLLEYAVGDLWNQAGDDLITNGGTDITNALMVANLGRFVGASKEVNPRYPYLSYLAEYTHKFYSGDGYVGTREAVLSILPDSGTSYTWSGTGAPTTEATDAYEVTISGRYYIDKTTGRCLFYDAIASDWKVTYTPNVTSSYDQATTSSFNIIPDPDTHTSYGFRGCKIAYYNNTDNSQGYIIYLPPRGPLSTRTLMRGPQSPYDSSANTDNIDTTPTSGNKLFWQSSAIAATTNSTAALHYRYLLPSIITDNWGNASPLPAGLIWLWDHSQTQTIIEGLTFTAEPIASPSKWAFVVSGSAMDTWIANYGNDIYPAGYLTAKTTHTSSYYPANGLRVVTVGTSLAQLVGSLYKKFFEHNHGGAYAHTNIPNKLISHENLIDCFVAEGDAAERYYPSKLTHDWHPQYLHRQGYKSTSIRDPYNNGMLGDLLMLSTSSTSNYQNTSSSSNKILFGHPTTGSSIYYDSVNGGLRFAGLHSYFTARNIWLSNHDNTAQHKLMFTFYDYLLSGSSGTTRLFVDASADGDGSLVVEDASESEGSKRGGSLYCARYYGGEDDDGEYGDSGGDFGPVRKWIIYPQDFVDFTSNTTYENAVGGVYHANALTSNTVMYETSGAVDKIISTGKAVYCPSGTDTNYAFAFINIPFRSYAIVNVLCDFYHTFNSLNIGALALGYSAFVGSIYAGSVDTAKDFHDWGATPINTWSGPLEIASPSSTPLIVCGNNVDNTAPSYYPTSLAHCMPWIRIRCATTGGVDYVQVRPIIVLYRVKEF